MSVFLDVDKLTAIDHRVPSLSTLPTRSTSNQAGFKERERFTASSDDEKTGFFFEKARRETKMRASFKLTNQI